MIKFVKMFVNVKNVFEKKSFIYYYIAQKKPS